MLLRCTTKRKKETHSKQIIFEIRMQARYRTWRVQGQGFFNARKLKTDLLRLYTYSVAKATKQKIFFVYGLIPHQLRTSTCRSMFSFTGSQFRRSFTKLHRKPCNRHHQNYRLSFGSDTIFSGPYNKYLGGEGRRN